MTGPKAGAHTPGPWAVTHSALTDDILVIGPTSDKPKQVPELICTVNQIVRHRYGKPADPTACATVLAAAPEMLALLKLAESALNSCPRHRIIGGPEDGCKDSYDVAAKLGALLRRFK